MLGWLLNLGFAGSTEFLEDLDMAAAKNWGSVATSTAVASGTADAQGVVAKAGLIFMGVSVTESAATAAAAEVVLRHGTGAADPMLISPVNVAANENKVHWLGSVGVAAKDGIFVDRMSGETTLVIYHNQEE